MSEALKKALGEEAVANTTASKPEAIGKDSGAVVTEEAVKVSKTHLTIPITVTLLKDWGDNKEGDALDLTDISVLKAGVEAGLFEAYAEEQEVSE